MPESSRKDTTPGEFGGRRCFRRHTGDAAADATYIPQIRAENVLTAKEVGPVSDVLIGVLVFRVSGTALGLLEVKPRQEGGGGIPDDAQVLRTGIDGAGKLVGLEDPGL